MKVPSNRSGASQPIDPIGNSGSNTGSEPVQMNLPSNAGIPVDRKGVLKNAQEVLKGSAPEHVKKLALAVKDSNGIIPQGGPLVALGRVNAVEYACEVIRDAGQE